MPLGETWEWDGSRWCLRSSWTAGLSGRAVWSMGYVTPLRKTIILSGFTGTGFVHDEWEWQTPRLADYQILRGGCAPISPAPILRTNSIGPRSDDDFVVTLLPGSLAPSAAVMLTGFSSVTGGGHTLPLALSSYGLSGCSLWVAAELAFPMTESSSELTWSARIPPDPAFLAARVWQQALLLDLGANPAGATVSRTAEATIGVR
ncbi:MAG: hypothetical protein IT457_19725 [Planctomycetes bacterium]|nr:hypothetical protein [Planctomycetota bacterium]